MEKKLIISIFNYNTNYYIIILLYYRITKLS